MWGLAQTLKNSPLPLSLLDPTLAQGDPAGNTLPAPRFARLNDHSPVLVCFTPLHPTFANGLGEARLWGNPFHEGPATRFDACANAGLFSYGIRRALATLLAVAFAWLVEI